MLSDEDSAYANAVRDIETGAQCEDAFRILLRLAKGGYMNAMNHVANCYASGVAVAQNSREALRWWRRGAASGNVLCMINMATEYRDRLGNRKRAIFWLQKAAEAGSADAYLKLAETFYRIDRLKYKQRILAMISNARSADDFLSEESVDRINEMLLDLDRDQR